jgi:sulfur relay (sulfurtransferase) complex TusBCD TusD component (DsrE family)
MHYRVESAALPKVRAFKNRDTAVAFAKALAKNTPHEVRVVLYTGGSGFGNHVLYVFNRCQCGSE